MLLVLKGFIIGIGKIIPGVSGSLLAIRLNVYEDIIYSINNLFKDLKNNIIFLAKLGIGILSSIVIGSNIIMYLLNKFYLITMVVFILLILSGIPSVIKEVKNYYISLIALVIYMLLLYIPNMSVINNNYFFMGFLESFTTIIPGISGTALFMSFGMYDELLSLFSNFLNFEFNKLIPFGLGIIVGCLIIVRFIDYCFKRYRDKTYSVILGLLIGSIISIIIKR